MLFVSSNLIIEPHPEEYLADRIGKAAAKMNIEDHDKEEDEQNKDVRVNGS